MNTNEDDGSVPAHAEVLNKGGVLVPNVPTLDDDLAALLSKVKEDVQDNLQKLLLNHTMFCENSFEKLQRSLSKRQSSISRREQSSDTPTDIQVAFEQQAGTIQQGLGQRMLQRLHSKVTVPAAATNRNSKPVSAVAAQRQTQDMNQLTKCVQSVQFDIAVALLIIANCVFLGFQVERDHNSHSTDILQVLFCCLFSIELALRFIADRRGFVRKDIMWNIFDTFTVVGSILEICLKWASSQMYSSSSNLLVLRSLRFLRFVRVARMLRVKAMRELRLMLRSVMCCVKPLTWAVTLLGIEVYVVAMIFTQAARDSMRKGTLPQTALDLLDPSFTTMVSSMYNLLGFVLGGADWLPYADAFKTIHSGYKFCLTGYIVFTQLALLNVVAAISVDSSMNAAMHDRQMMIQEELMREGEHKMELEALFKEASNGEDEVSVQQLKEYLKDERVNTYLRLLDIHYKDPQDLCSLLDEDNNGAVDVEEFVKGCWTLQTQQMTDVTSMLQAMDQTLKILSRSVEAKALSCSAEQEALHQSQHGRDLYVENVRDTFNVACGQLKAAHQDLRDVQGNLGNLTSNLQAATTDMDRVCLDLQEKVSSRPESAPDELSNLREELQQLRTLVKLQVDALTSFQQEQKSKAHNTWVCDNTLDEGGPDTPRFAPNRPFDPPVTPAEEGIPCMAVQLPSSAEVNLELARLRPRFDTNPGARISNVGGDLGPAEMDAGFEGHQSSRDCVAWPCVRR